jgi:5-methylcytosine-specific restriction endonuclease McrA
MGTFLLKLMKAGTKGKHCYYWCLCSCGNVVKKRGDFFKKAKHCGCGVEFVSKGNLERLYKKYARDARYREIWFGLSFPEFIYLITQKCYYCGVKPSNKIKTKTGIYRVSGVDRLNSDSSYVVSNCVPCCSRCNYAKGVMEVTTFLKHIKKIYKYKIKNVKASKRRTNS